MSRSLVNATDFLKLAHSEITILKMRDIPESQRNGITQKQRNYLHNMGIGYAQLHYHGQVDAVLNVAIKREKAGLATPAQMRAMESMGVSDVHIRTKEEAAYILDGGDPEEFDGFVVMFRFNGNNTVTETTRTNARKRLTWLRLRYDKVEYRLL